MSYPSRHKFSSVYIPAFVLCFLIGCTAQRGGLGNRSDAVTDSGIFSDTLTAFPPQQVEDLPPLRLATPGFFVEPEIIDLKQYQPNDDVVEVDESTDGELNQVVSGYRVQLFAGRERTQARLIETKANSSYLQTVYLVFESPQYKVRIGDFTNRDEAVRFCQKLRKDGYSDTWVVKSPVNLRR